MRTSRVGTCRGGFTLLELIVALALLSVILMLAFPSFQGTEEASLQADAKRVASLLTFLNDTAIATKETQLLSLDLNQKTIKWKEGQMEKILEVRYIETLSIPSRGVLSSGQVQISFGPLGLQEGISITMKEKDRVIAVTFNPANGIAKVRGHEG